MLEGMGLWVATLLLGQFSMMGGDPRREFAAGDKDAVLLFPPETVCGAVAGEMVWTADSSALVVVRTSATIGPDDVMRFMGGARPSEADVARLQPRIELLTWSTKTKKVRSIASADASHLMVSGIQPLSGSDRVVLGLTEVANGPNGEPLATHSVALLSAATGTLTRLSSVGQKDAMESFSVSPTRPLGFIHRVDRTQGFDTVRFFGPDGRLGNPLKLAAGSNVDFDDKGLPTLMTIERQRGAKPRARITRIDPTVPRLLDTVDFVPPKEAKAPAKEPEKALGIQLITGTVSGASAPSIFLKVAGGKPEEMGVVTTDGTRGLLSPKGDAIAYVSQGSAMVRLMAKVPRSAYDQARMAAERRGGAKVLPELQKSLLEQTPPKQAPYGGSISITTSPDSE